MKFCIWFAQCRYSTYTIPRRRRRLLYVWYDVNVFSSGLACTTYSYVWEVLRSRDETYGKIGCLHRSSWDNLFVLSRDEVININAQLPSFLPSFQLGWLTLHIFMLLPFCICMYVCMNVGMWICVRACGAGRAGVQYVLLVSRNIKSLHEFKTGSRINFGIVGAGYEIILLLPAARLWPTDRPTRGSFIFFFFSSLLLFQFLF